MGNNIQRKKIAVGKTGDNNGVEIFQGFDDDNIYYKNRKGGLVQLPDLETVQGLVTAADELSEVLANGNTTGGSDIVTSNDDVIVAQSGSGTLDLRADSTDDIVMLSNDNGAYSDSGVYLAPNTATLFSGGWGPAIEAQMFGGTNPRIQAYLGVDNVGITMTSAEQISVNYGLAVFKSSTNNTSSNDTGLQQYAAIIAAENAVMNAGVSNTVIIGGDGITAKTSNTAYLNQLGFFESGTIEGILSADTLTADRTWGLPDASGTIALTSDIPSQGIFGISDSSGVYTFYATIALANAAASSGDTIELFADHEETGSVEFIMKDGVTYNLNGHTYTLNVATTENTITDNNVAITSTLMNGRFIRTGGTAATGDSMTIHIDNTSSSIICEGVIFESDFGLVVRADGGIEGATFKNTVYTGYMAYNVTGSGYFNNCSFESAAGGGVFLYGSLNDSIVIANGSVGVGSVGGACNNCVVVSTANSGIAVQGTARIQNCVITSTSSYGVQTQANGPVRMSNSTVVSTASYALYGLHDIIVENCSLYSSTNNGAYTGGTIRLENSVIKSAADAAVRLGGGYMGGCHVYSSWNNASGHAVECTTGSTVFNNILEVANTSANNIKNEGVTPTVTYGQNTYKGGATTPVEATIVQGQTNTHDTYGNIDIG